MRENETEIQIEVLEQLIDAYDKQLAVCRHAQTVLIPLWEKDFYANKIMQLQLERDGYQLRLDKLKAKQNDF